jgi:hypothetical protein
MTPYFCLATSPSPVRVVLGQGGPGPGWSWARVGTASSAGVIVSAIIPPSGACMYPSPTHQSRVGIRAFYISSHTVVQHLLFE